MAEETNQLQAAPEETSFDYAMTLAQISALAFPVLAPGVTFLELITRPARGKRLNDWCEEMRLRLNDLSRTVKGLTPEALATNDEFISAFAQATQSALKTHHPQKLQALRNAVLNIAIGGSPEEAEQAAFLGYIDELSTWHLQILEFLQNPLKLVAERNGQTDYSFGSLSQPLEEIFPQLRGRQEFYDQILRDLRARGFVNSSESLFHSTMSGSAIFAKRTTKIADDFLEFIKSPTGEE